jgi:hypothetical protein
MGDVSESYTLDGKETKISVEGPNGPMPVVLRAEAQSDKLQLTSSRTFSGQMGEMTATKKEVWALSDDGKTLTIVRENITPRGTSSSTLVFNKK